MGILHKSCATLSFRGDDLDPSEITQRLGVEPTIGVRKGGKWLTKRGVEKVAATGSWRLETDRCEPADLDCQVNGLLVGLTGDLSIWRPFAERYRGAIFCGLFLASGNEGVILQPHTLTRLGERGLLLDLDIYEQGSLE